MLIDLDVHVSAGDQLKTGMFSAVENKVYDQSDASLRVAWKRRNCFGVCNGYDDCVKNFQGCFIFFIYRELYSRTHKHITEMIDRSQRK